MVLFCNNLSAIFLILFYFLIVVLVASITYKKIEIPFREGLKKTRFFKNIS